MGKEEEVKADEEEEEEEPGGFNLRFLTHGRGARRTFVGTTSATHRGELGGVSRPRGSQTRFRFSTSLSLPRCSPSTYSAVSLSPAFPSLIFFLPLHPSQSLFSVLLRHSLIKARVASSSSRETPWARERKTSFHPGSPRRLSFVCTASTAVRWCLRVRISCLPQVTSRPPTRDSRDRSIFPVASRTRYHRIRSNFEVLLLGLAPFALSPRPAACPATLLSRPSLLENA